MKANQFFSKNGEILPINEAHVSLTSIEYAYGFGVYETLRSVKGACIFLSEHVERLMRSAEIIGLEHTFTADSVAKAITSLVERDPESTYNIKVLLIGATTPQGATLYVFCSNPLFPDKKLYRDGVSLITAQYERIYPHAKTLNMLQSYLSYRDASRKGCYDALLINRNGNITEGTRTNFFAISGTTLVSPPESEILIGVTRTNVLKTAQSIGLTIEHRDIPLESLTSFDGAFLTSTSTKIMPIKKIDTFEFATIPATTRELMGAFDRYLKQ